MFIALLAPVIGQRSDARGTRRRSVRVWTLITIVIMLSLYFIRNDDPIYFWLGITILAIGSVTYELGEVSYFAMLNQVSTEKNVGRVSGFWLGPGLFWRHFPTAHLLLRVHRRRRRLPAHLHGGWPQCAPGGHHVRPMVSRLWVAGHVPGAGNSAKSEHRFGWFCRIL